MLMWTERWGSSSGWKQYGVRPGLRQFKEIQRSADKGCGNRVLCEISWTLN